MRSSSRSTVAVCLAFALSTAMADQQNRPAEEPSHNGKSLSSSADELMRKDRITVFCNTNRDDVQAMRAFGTNAIPWLLSELRKHPDSASIRTNDHPTVDPNLLARTGSNYYALRARSAFWALGETAQPAIPRLMKILEQQPDIVPSCLAGIGAPALPALESCLTNPSPDMHSKGPRMRSVDSALAGLFVAIDGGRITTNQAAYLLPVVRTWANSTNAEARYWADGVLRQFSHDR